MQNRELGTIVSGFQTLLDSGTSSALTDSQLLERFTRRSDDASQAAFSALVYRHGPMVLRVCVGVLRDAHAAEDAFQATFLILARKAHAIRDRESVASWLFGVARRVSCRARTQRSRRERHEQTGLPLPDPRMVAPDRRPELLPEVTEVVDRLPEKYRLPIVLCYLEGMTHQEAADQLRLPVGTVKVRLARARQRLRGPLMRRGLAPSSITAWMGAEARGAIPRHLVDATVRGALHPAPGRAAGISVSIAALVDGGLKAMYLSRLKSLLVVLSACPCLRDCHGDPGIGILPASEVRSGRFRPTGGGREPRCRCCHCQEV